MPVRAGSRWPRDPATRSGADPGGSRGRPADPNRGPGQRPVPRRRQRATQDRGPGHGPGGGREKHPRGRGQPGPGSNRLQRTDHDPRPDEQRPHQAGEEPGRERGQCPRTEHPARVHRPGGRLRRPPAPRRNRRRAQRRSGQRASHDRRGHPCRRAARLRRQRPVDRLRHHERPAPPGQHRADPGGRRHGRHPRPPGATGQNPPRRTQSLAVRRRGPRLHPVGTLRARPERVAHRVRRGARGARCRPAVQRIAGDLAALSRGHLRTEVVEFAHRVGIPV